MPWKQYICGNDNDAPIPHPQSALDRGSVLLAISFNMSALVPTMNYQSEGNSVEDKKDIKNVYDEEHVEAAAVGARRGTVIAQDYGQYIHDASDAVTGEKTQSIMASLKQYKYGVMFSIVFSS